MQEVVLGEWGVEVEDAEGGEGGSRRSVKRWNLFLGFLLACFVDCEGRQDCKSGQKAVARAARESPGTGARRKNGVARREWSHR